jgi:nitroreductase
LKSAAAKAKLEPALSPGNVPQVHSAAVTVIVAQDIRFPEQLPTQFPGYDAKALFDANPAMTDIAGARNSSMQGAYLILAARALGLDSCAMSGFNPQAVNEAFFADGQYKANFLINLGVADPAGVYPRGPRLAFNDVAQIL